MKCIDYDKLCDKIQHPDCMLCSAGDYGRWLDECLDKSDVFKAITREQFVEAAKQLMNEFTKNDDYKTSVSVTFLALCFSNLELRLFGMNGDNNG